MNLIRNIWFEKVCDYALQISFEDKFFFTLYQLSYLKIFLLIRFQDILQTKNIYEIVSLKIRIFVVENVALKLF